MSQFGDAVPDASRPILTLETITLIMDTVRTLVELYHEWPEPRFVAASLGLLECHDEPPRRDRNWNEE